jgi:hypothetical protein
MTEIFPLRNYVFLMKVLVKFQIDVLTKNQVKDFKEDQLKHLLQKIYQIVQNVK